MKIKSVRIKNFRLLRDLQLEFGDDPSRPLTVVRAENGSGKTSTLMALEWGLYGVEGLDDKSMRLSRVTWPAGEECQITVQIDFSHTRYNLIAGESVGTTTDYRLVRTVSERPDGERINRGEDLVILYEVTDGGLSKAPTPGRDIEEMLPLEMKDIFFTDGDSALTFISPQLSRASRRDKVKEAIRSLLGLGLLESAAGHIASVKKNANSEVSNLSQSGELAEVTQKLSAATDTKAQMEASLRDVERQIEDLARRLADADKRLEVALQTGDYDEIVELASVAKSQLGEARDNEKPLKERHQRLLQDERLSLILLRSRLQAGFGELAKLHQAGVIPSGSVPVLQERLDIKVCFCGTPLTAGSDARAHVEHFLAEQRTIDDQRKILTELHHAAKVDLQRAESAGTDWLSDLLSLERGRLTNRRVIDSSQDQLRVLNEKISKIDRAGINECRQDRDALRAGLTAKQDERRDLQTEIDKADATIKTLNPKQAELLKQDRKLGQLTRRLEVVADVAEVVRGALEDLGELYVRRVSERMNQLFLEMVGADTETMRLAGESTGKKYVSHVFAGAGITPSYEIVVHSIDGNMLNVETDLNGASKRALTFAFIWALTEVSQVIAPRIIDTPLGMMSGLVKERVIQLITAPAGSHTDTEKQVVLFLTRDEIRGIEHVIDDRASRVVTLTNTDQYPVDVLNDPGLETPEILKCECNHRQSCRTCARRNDKQYELTDRPLV